MGKKTKRALARQLFMDGVRQGVIGEALQVSPNTVSRWKKNDNWQSARNARRLMEETSEEVVRELIAYQLDALRKRKNEWINEGQYRLLERGDIDALQKLFTTVKRTEMQWSDYVRSIRELIEYSEKQDLPFAKRLAEIAQNFLSDKRQFMGT